MRLKTLKITNFRAYQGEVVVPISNLTAFVGKNDAGKSTIFDALGVFFEHEACKIDGGDICKRATSAEVRITCVFEDLPEFIVLDETARTTLQGEYLVNQDGDLELARVWPVTDGRLGKVKMVAIASHPTAPQVDDLLSKKNNDLKALARTLGANVQNLSVNVELRRGIWAATSDLQKQTVEIQLDKGDNQKAISEQFTKVLPTFALFRADRPSTDDDSEVQDPMKLAIKEAMTLVQAETAEIIEHVRAKALEVARRTVAKLKDFDPSLASELIPTFKADPKWDSLFKLSLTGDDDIPVNKRGSGVRRLILFSFFRAEAERKRGAAGNPNIIYAVEEPETAQHPENQRKVMEALGLLAEDDGCQVMLTTHTPALAGLVPVASLRYITIEAGSCAREVKLGTPIVLDEIAAALGVFPGPNVVATSGQSPLVKVLVCVEGPNDINLFRHLNRAYREADATAVDLSSDPTVAMIPLGGSTLVEWVTEQYLRGFGVPEVHIYDRDAKTPGDPPQYEDAVNQVNGRPDASWAVLTRKLMAECYLHHDAVADAALAFLEHEREERIVASGGRAQLPAAARPVVPVIGDEENIAETRKTMLAGHRLPKNFKAWLNSDAATFMNHARLVERGAVDELKTWFDKIAELASASGAA